MLGHSYGAEARNVLRDMHHLLNDGAAPDQRFNLKPKNNEHGQRYWEIGSQSLTQKVVALALVA